MTQVLYAHYDAHMNKIKEKLQLYDSSASKKATNLSINSDLLTRSKALNINLSATLEQALSAKLAAEHSKAWKKDNAHAIQLYNEHIEKHGLFADDIRLF